MWEFRGLSMTKSASKQKSRVKPAATGFKHKWNQLDKEHKLWITVLLLWAVACVYLYVNSSESDSIDMDRYWDSIEQTDTDRLA